MPGTGNSSPDMQGIERTPDHHFHQERFAARRFMDSALILHRDPHRQRVPTGFRTYEKVGSQATPGHNRGGFREGTYGYSPMKHRQGEVDGKYGVWELEAGEGGASPPVGPSPRGDSHHGPLHGENPERSRARLPTGYREHCPRPRGAGEEAEGLVGWRLPKKRTGIPLRRRGRGGGCRRVCMSSPPAGKRVPGAGSCPSHLT